jgi:hypothetical protein
LTLLGIIGINEGVIDLSTAPEEFKADTIDGAREWSRSLPRPGRRPAGRLPSALLRALLHRR